MNFGLIAGEPSAVQFEHCLGLFEGKPLAVLDALSEGWSYSLPVYDPERHFATSVLPWSHRYHPMDAVVLIKKCKLAVVAVLPKLRRIEVAVGRSQMTSGQTCH